MAVIILLVEDEPDTAEIVRLYLQHEGYRVLMATNGTDALRQAKEIEPDLIILDLMLPKMDGLEVCKTLRSQDINTPILMLTAKSEEFDKVLGLELGADDYLTKPFSIRELLARVKANLRRVEVDKKESMLKKDKTELNIGAVKLDSSKRKVTISGEAISLTPKEFQLLHLFASNPGKAFSREDLLTEIWGYQFEGYDHTVNSHINRLRNKIETDPSDPVYLKTVWGVGYRFVEPEEIER
jgi:DNA-binding response OmpR family regulator